jgi:hypothetical protein
MYVTEKKIHSNLKIELSPKNSVIIYLTWASKSIILQLCLTLINVRIAGDDTSKDKIHIPHMIKIVCLWVNFVRNGCIIAKYLNKITK